MDCDNISKFFRADTKMRVNRTNMIFLRGLEKTATTESFLRFCKKGPKLWTMHPGSDIQILGGGKSKTADVVVSHEEEVKRKGMLQGVLSLFYMSKSGKEDEKYRIKSESELKAEKAAAAAAAAAAAEDEIDPSLLFYVKPPSANNLHQMIPLEPDRPEGHPPGVPVEDTRTFQNEVQYGIGKTKRRWQKMTAKDYSQRNLVECTMDARSFGQKLYFSNLPIPVQAFVAIDVYVNEVSYNENFVRKHEEYKAKKAKIE